MTYNNERDNARTQQGGNSSSGQQGGSTRQGQGSESDDSNKSK